MRTKLTSRLSLLFVSFALMLALPAIAFADNTVADGDGLTPVANQNMAVGDVACDVATDKDARVAITRQGAAGSTNVFANGSKATVTVQSVTGAGLSAKMGASNTITLPSDWSSKSNGTLSDSVLSTVTVDSSVEGAGSGSVTYVATGVSSKDGTALTRTDVMDVTWTTGSCAPADSTAPVIGYTLNPASPDGANGWYKSNVSLAWTVTENESASSLQTTGCVDQTITADQAATTYSCSATSDGGSAGPESVSIKRDGTAPVVTLGSVSGTAGDNGWYKSAVTQTFNASDATSGLAGPASIPVSSGAQEEGSNVNIVSGPVSDNAGNTNNGMNAGPFEVDLSDPTNVRFTGGGITNGASYDFGSVPAAPTGCTADDAISGLAGCAVTGYSTAVGTHKLTATATDNAGRTATATLSYTVAAATAKGFYSPIDMNNTLNTVKGGSTVPAKFELFGGASGVEQKALSAVSSVSAKQINCATLTGAADAIEEIISTSATGLRFDTTGDQFIYNWKTPKSPGTCYSLTMTAADQQTKLVAFFKLT